MAAAGRRNLQWPPLVLQFSWNPQAEGPSVRLWHYPVSQLLVQMIRDSMNSCSDFLCCLSALYPPPSVSLSVFHSVKHSPLLSALVTLKQLSCHKTGSLSPPATRLLPTTTWSAHLNLHQKCLGSPSRYKSQASGTCCCSRPKHSGRQCPLPPDLLLSSPPLFQLPRLPAYFHCGLASLSSHMAIFCCFWSLLLSLCAVSASLFLMLPAQPALLTGKEHRREALCWTQCYNASRNTVREGVSQLSG